MLVERAIVSRQDGAAILRALTDLERAGVESIPSRPDLNDLFTCTEVHLLERLGPRRASVGAPSLALAVGSSVSPSRSLSTPGG
jgi:argininosuccinate lyase